MDDVVVLVKVDDGLEALHDDLRHDVLVEGSSSEGELRRDHVHDVSDNHASGREGEGEGRALCVGGVAHGRGRGVYGDHVGGKGGRGELVEEDGLIDEGRGGGVELVEGRGVLVSLWVAEVHLKLG